MNQHEYSIRFCNPETDLPAIETILTQADMFDPDRDTPQRLQNALSEDPNCILVADAGGEVVGSVYVNPGIMPFLWRLAVREDWRRRGIGSALLNAGVTELHRRGHPDVEVFLDAQDETLAAWYARRGFEPSAGGLYRSMWRPVAPE